MSGMKISGTVWIAASAILLLAPGPARAAETCTPAATVGTTAGETGNAGPAVPLLPADVLPLATCTATASCGVHPDVHCSGDSTCIAVDRNCVYGGANQNGYVKCDGVTKNCAKDSGCTLDCLDRFEACSAGCTTFYPCVDECQKSHAYCRCNC